MNFSLTTYYEGIIEKAIESGISANASEEVRASLRLLEKELERKAKLRDLRAAIQAGEDSGEPVPFDIEKSVNYTEKRRAQRKIGLSTQVD